MDLNNFAKEANDDMVWKAGEDEPSFKKSPVSLNDLPQTHEKVLQNLQHNGIDQNFLERDAYEKGIDFDADTKDEFNRVNNEE